MLSDYDIGYSLIGHSESRKFLNESNQDILKKYKQLKKYSIKPIICIGESSEVREKNLFSSFINEQLSLFTNIKDEMIVAYEPIWSIGTGKIPTESELRKTITHIKKVLKKIFKKNSL